MGERQLLFGAQRAGHARPATERQNRVCGKAAGRACWPLRVARLRIFGNVTRMVVRCRPGSAGQFCVVQQAMCLTMASPKPVPPVALSDSCPRGRTAQTRVWLSCGMPMPLSSTSKYGQPSPPTPQRSPHGRPGGCSGWHCRTNSASVRSIGRGCRARRVLASYCSVT